jgi:hypothetical protein
VIRRWLLALRAAAPVIVLGMSCMLAMSAACIPEDAPPAGRPDARVQTHVVLPSTPTPAGLAYIEAVAGVHTRADAASEAAAVSILRGGLALPVPAGLGEAEILRLELATRLAQTLLQTSEGVPVAIDVLSPMLRPGDSLPLDRATARALVVLGDAAGKSGNDALAAGSYARAIRVMSLLRQELEP